MIRATTALRVSALIRRIEAEGGFATVIAKGDDTAGSLLLLLLDKGRNPRLFEPLLGISGGYEWREIPCQDTDKSQEILDLVERRRRRDPDLWVVELDIPHPERFVDGTTGSI